MDRKSILAIVIITLILVLYPYYMEFISPPPTTEQPLVQDTTLIQPGLDQPIKKTPSRPVAAPPKAEVIADRQEKKGGPAPETFGIIEDTVQHIIRFESEFVSAKLSNFNGGQLTSWKLLAYKGPDGNPVDMVDSNSISIEFNDWSGEYIDLSNYNFFVDDEKNGDNTHTVDMSLPYKGGRVVKRYVFNKKSYDLSLSIKFEGLTDNFIGKSYSLTWKNGLPVAEQAVTEDASYASGQVRIAGDLEIYKEAGEEPSLIEGSNIQWASVRIKYFAAAVVPQDDKEKVSSVKLFGKKSKIGETDYGRYSFAMNVRHPQPESEDHFLLYLGPLNYDVVKEYNADLDDMVLGSSGYERFFRPFSMAMLWILKQLHTVIPNYGIAIIVFSILLKLILFPFTKSSYKSMKAMQKLQPEMKAMKEKYKNDPQMMQKKTMALYKEHKVNPMGGCLPMFLQMPVLFAMYILFRSTVQIRGEAFFWWISDLSRPDTIMSLPFSLPFYGDQVNILPILMAITMFFQQKQSITDQTQKFMIYFFPVMMLLIFNQFPSGLNLYYTLFNLLTIAQQHFIKINEADYKLGTTKKKTELAFNLLKKKK